MPLIWPTGGSNERRDL